MKVNRVSKQPVELDRELSRPRHSRTRVHRRCASALFVLWLSPACGVEEPAPWRPDVVFIMIDTARADHLGPFTDQDPVPTPFLDRLAARSVVFENAWTAATSTAPSTASVFTGLIPARHGVEGNLLGGLVRPRRPDESLREFVSSVEHVALPPSVPTLTEHLADAGYQTLGVGANPNFCEALGFSRGFDLFSEHSYRDAEAMAAEVRALSKELQPGVPTFTYLHYMDPHIPYTRRPPWCPHEDQVGCRTLCRYRSEIAYLDSQLGLLFDEMGWLEDTLVVVVTDHGEEFLDHGDIMHRYSVHQELARAGLLIHVPGVEPRRTALPAHHTDLLPTVLEVLDLAWPETMDGIPLMPALDTPPEFDRPLLTCKTKKTATLWGLTTGKWRLLQEEPTGAAKLYDIEQDPREEHDLATQMPEVLESLQERLADIRSEIRPLPREHVTIDMTEALNRELIKLGYVGSDEEEE